jgi:hypothetical protein
MYACERPSPEGQAFLLYYLNRQTEEAPVFCQISVSALDTSPLMLTIFFQCLEDV